MTSKPPVKETATLKGFVSDERLFGFINYFLLLFATMTFGLTALIAMLIANFAEHKAPDWMKTHYQFQVYSFWYGIGPVLATALLYTFVQRHGLTGTITYVMLGLVLFSLAYTVGRAITGFNHLLYSRPYPNPKAILV